MFQIIHKDQTESQVDGHTGNGDDHGFFRILKSVKRPIQNLNTAVGKDPDAVKIQRVGHGLGIAAGKFTDLIKEADKRHAENNQQNRAGNHDKEDGAHTVSEIFTEAFQIPQRRFP